MNYIQIAIEAREEQQEILISRLAELNATGFEQNEKSLIAYFNENDFLSYDVNEAVKDFVHHTTTVKEQNWNEVWETNFQPVIVDDFCAVRAHFHEPIKNVQHEIIITPKMSFGTGHHATTFMMMQHMREMDFRGKTVFDFGTGTGILSILAEKLGAASVYAIDNDKWSIENGKENAAINSCTKIDLCFESSVPNKTFDIILANINRNVILMHLPYIAKAVEKDGAILFSGLLKEDEQTIVDACRDYKLHLLKQKEKQNWISLLFVKGT